MDGCHTLVVGGSTQAYLSLRLFELGFTNCLEFFGFFCLLQGYLIYRSGFMPRFVGILLAFEGVCYLVNSFTNFLAPQFSGLAFSVLSLSVVGEVSPCLWPLVKAVNVPKWNAQARSIVQGLILSRICLPPQVLAHRPPRSLSRGGREPSLVLR